VPVTVDLLTIEAYLVCLLRLKLGMQLDKKYNNSAERFFLKAERVLLCCFKQNRCFKKHLF